MYSGMQINSEDSKKLTGHTPMNDSAGVLGGSVTGTSRDAIEVPLIHKIVENWAKPGYSLPVMVAWVREYGRTFFVMKSQDLIRDRDDWKAKAVGMLQQVEAEEAKNRKASSMHEYDETRLANQAVTITDLQKTELELRQLLRGVLDCNHGAFRKAGEFLGLNPVDQLKKVREAKGMAAGSAKTMVDILLNTLNSISEPRGPQPYYPDSCREELEKTKKDLQLKDIELQEARHKLKRMEEYNHKNGITNWQDNYLAAAAELQEARDKINRMTQEFHDVVKADMAGTPRPIQTAIDYHRLWKEQVEVNRQHVVDYNKMGEQFRSVETAAANWKNKYIGLSKQIDHLGKRLKEMFPQYVKETQNPSGELRFDIDDKGLELIWKEMLSYSKPRQVSLGLGMLSPFIGIAGLDPNPWSAEAQPSNTDYRALYHASQGEISAWRRNYLNLSGERDAIKIQLDLRNRLIADKNQVIEAMKKRTSEVKGEGWMNPAAAKNLKDQAKMWKTRYEKLNRDLDDVIGGSPKSDVSVSLADYRARIEEINALHRKMEDVYNHIKQYLPADHNLPADYNHLHR